MMPSRTLLDAYISDGANEARYLSFADTRNWGAREALKTVSVNTPDTDTLRSGL